MLSHKLILFQTFRGMGSLSLEAMLTASFRLPNGEAVLVSAKAFKAGITQPASLATFVAIDMCGSVLSFRRLCSTGAAPGLHLNRSVVECT